VTGPRTTVDECGTLEMLADAGRANLLSLGES
jgi:hypothetical protein